MIITILWILFSVVLIFMGVCLIWSLGILLILLGIVSILFALRRDVSNMPYDDIGWSSFRRAGGWILAIGIIATVFIVNKTPWPIPTGLAAIQGFMFATFILAFRDPIFVGWAILRKNPQHVLHKLSATVSLILWILLYVINMYSLSSGAWG